MSEDEDEEEVVVTLGDVRNGAVVLVDGRWGVVCRGLSGSAHGTYVIVDFWEGGREKLARDSEVEVAEGP